MKLLAIRFAVLWCWIPGLAIGDSSLPMEHPNRHSDAYRSDVTTPTRSNNNGLLRVDFVRDDRSIAGRQRDDLGARATGPKCDGVSDDTAAFMAAAAEQGAIRIPAGTCVLSGPISKTGALAITGEGSGVSVLRWMAPTPNGAINVRKGPLTLRGLALKTAVSGGGVAVAFDGGATAPGVIADDIVVRGDASLRTQWWNKGFVLTNARESTFRSINIRGDMDDETAMTAGIELTATSGSTAIAFDAILVHSAATGIQATSSSKPGIEGLYVSNSSFLTRVGIVFDGTSAGYVPPGLQVINTHLNVTDKAIEGRGIAQALLSNNLIYRRAGTKNPVVSFYGGSGLTVSANYIVMLSGATTPDAIYFYGAANTCSVTGNTINLQPGSSQAAVQLQGSTSGCVVTGNIRSGGTTTVNNASSAASENFVTGNFPAPALSVFQIADGVTTPIVSGRPVYSLRTLNTAATSITSFIVKSGIQFSLLVGDDHTTLVHSPSIRLKGSTNHSPPNGSVLQFQAESDNVVREISRN